jgi:formylglycine-generating enzyme required for sulfatase activity/DNA-binding NarL/FixJ family response regulator
MRIILVDDESAVLPELLPILKAIPGHEVRVATNSQKAHEHATALGGVDLLITDVVMEPTDGFTLRAEFQSMYPSMRVLFISGYDLSDYAEHLGGAASLPKPVDGGALREFVENAAAEFEASTRPTAKIPAAVAQPVASGVRAPQAVPQAQPVAVPQAVPQPVASGVRAPQAVPHAQPVATPQAVPQPVASGVRAPQAVPQAQPVAVPQAVPQAVASGVRVPQAVPQAQPVAAPQAVPQPVASGIRAPQAVPQAQPVAVPQAVPQAVASGVRAPQAVPQAQPVAAPQAVPQPVASGVRAPQAQPVQAVPVSGVRVAPVQAVAAPLASAVRPAVAADPLVGAVLGDYRIERILGSGIWGKVYAATQMSVNRLVGLKALDPQRSQESDSRDQFLADARAKAAVSHPFIVSVFEADERNGIFFYTHEFLDGATLADMIQQRRVMDEKTALHAMKVAGEGLNYLWTHNLAHGPFDASAVRIGTDGIARLANLATAGADSSISIQNELAVLADTIRQLLPANAMSQGLAMLLGRMQGGANPVTGWPAVLQAVKALEPKVVPVEAAKMKAADAAAMRAVEAARKAQKRAVIVNIATLSFLVLLIVWMVWKYIVSNERKLDAQISVPAGTYLVGDSGESVQLPGFEIDRFEVSIGRYAKFIEWCETSDNPFKYDHPKAPRHISHVNQDIVTLIKNAKVRDGRVFKNPKDGIPGAEVDLNSPIVGITWWDAYAFAKWEGKVIRGGEERDLPLEEEWEAAARGTKGFKFPWGDNFEAKKTNSGADYVPLRPGDVAKTDGYNYWAPVDKLSSDESQFKVEGMGGNVAEWVYRKDGGKETPLLKGGSFATGPTTMSDRVTKLPIDDCWLVYPANLKASTPNRPGEPERFFADDPITAGSRALYIGFRTVKRK